MSLVMSRLLASLPHKAYTWILKFTQTLSFFDRQFQSSTIDFEHNEAIKTSGFNKVYIQHFCQ